MASCHAYQRTMSALLYAVLLCVTPAPHVLAVDDLNSLDPLPVELRLRPGPENLQRALIADGVGPIENPVLPCADSRPKMRVSMVSAPAKRRFASMPVSASGDRLARSSMAMRTSSAQSMSSGAKVTRPSSSATAACSLSPIARAASGLVPARRRSVWQSVSDGSPSGSRRSSSRIARPPARRLLPGAAEAYSCDRPPAPAPAECRRSTIPGR